MSTKPPRSLKASPNGRANPAIPRPPAPPVTILAGGSSSLSIMVNVGDPSFEHHGEVRAGPRVPRRTRIVCAASHIMPFGRQRRGAQRRRAHRHSSMCATPAPHASERPPTDRSPTLLRRPTLQPFEETVATTLVQKKTRTVIDRTPSRRRSRRSSARCSSCSGCTSRRRRREGDAAGTRGRSSSRGAGSALVSKCSSPPRCSTRPRRRRALPRRCPRPAPRRRAACRRSIVHGLADAAFDAAIGLTCEGLLPEGPGVLTPLEQHGRPCFVCRFVESDV